MNDPNRLHPDAAPGELEMEARRIYGDARFEADREYNDFLLGINRGLQEERLDLEEAKSAISWAKADIWGMLVWLIPFMAVTLALAVLALVLL